MLGAVAAGAAGGGYDSLGEAAARMGGLKEQRYTPNTAEQPAYHELYALWLRLHEAFRAEGSDLMKRLRRLRGAGR